MLYRNVSCIFLLSCALLFISFVGGDKKTTNKIKTIVIDPGHGGKDSGTMGTKRYRIYEKHIALDVSLKLGAYISQSFPDIDVIYTRDSDVFLELNERTEIANKVDADLFISIHCDGFTNPQPSGASVFVMGMSKLKENMDVAMRENSAMYLEDNYQQKYEGFDPKSKESYIVFSLMQNAYLNQSLNIAEKVEKEFSIRANRKSRGVKQAPFYVISRTNMPSILIECGFLTNPQEEDFLHSDIGQDYIASAIFRAFRSYKEEMEGNLFEKTKKEKINKKKDEEKIIEVSNKNISQINNVVYRVQIGTYLKSMIHVPLFKEIGAYEENTQSIYKYYVGNSSDKNIVEEIRIDMKEKGFKDAFIVAFYKGKRISTKEALNLQKK